MEVRRSKDKASTSLATNEQYSFSSLVESFEQAKKRYKSNVSKIFTVLNDSELEKELNNFGVSWGNRLEKQARAFIPIYHACGGKESEALDYLLATKIFRRGKLTGRYDISSVQMQSIKDKLDEAWLELEYESEPHFSHTLLNKDILRLGDL